MPAPVAPDLQSQITFWEGESRPACASGPQREDHAGGIAAGIGNQFCTANAIGIQLRHAVDSFRQDALRAERELVPGGEGFGRGKAKRAAEIDHAESGVEEFRGQAPQKLRGA